MRPLLASLFVAFSVSAAPCQTVTDGTGSDLSSQQLDELMRIVTQDFKDPLSAQFRGLRRPGEGFMPQRRICGFVNGKNTFGGYVGFKPFFYDTIRKDFVILGASELSDLTFRSTGCLSALGVS